MDPRNRRELCVRGEEAVADWYRRARFAVVGRNWRCPDGELDVVAASPDGSTVVFCEVKTRTSTRFGTGFDAVTPAKQRRLRRLAARWLAEHRRAGGRPYPVIRFDVAAVTTSGLGDGVDSDMEIDVLEDAF